MSVIWMDGFGQYKDYSELALNYGRQGNGALDGTNLGVLPSGGPATTAGGKPRLPAPGALQFKGNLGFLEWAELVHDISAASTSEIIVAFNFSPDDFNSDSNYYYDNFLQLTDSNGGSVFQLEFEYNYGEQAEYPEIVGYFNLNLLTNNERWSGRDESIANPALHGLVRGEWYYVELRILLNNGGGTIEFRVNGETLYSETNVDTRPGTYDTFGTVNLKTCDTYASSNYGGGLAAKIADFYIVDVETAPNQDFLYPAVIDCLIPDADTAEADFTPSTGGDNFAGVDDENGHSYDTDYNESDTAGHKDRFTTAAKLPDSPKGDVMAVMVVAMVRDTADSGTRTARTVVYEGSTEGVGDTITLSESGYQPVSHLFATNPDTAAAWTIAEVEAAEFGIEVVS